MVNADRVQLNHGDMGQWYKRAIALSDINALMVQMDNFSTIKVDTPQHGPHGQLLPSSCWTISNLTIVNWTTGAMVQLNNFSIVQTNNWTIVTTDQWKRWSKRTIDQLEPRNT
jgi:hypothetical protein